MDDRGIVDLFFERSEEAIVQSRSKYHGYCYSIAFSVLGSKEDAEECVNDTYMRAWDSIPPDRPNRLDAFLGRITRNLAFDRYRKSRAQRRIRSSVTVALSELEECIPDGGRDSDMTDKIALADALSAFLRDLGEMDMKIFVLRYWFGLSVADIANRYDMGRSNVKIRLHRMRLELKKYLEKEGMFI